MLAVVLGWPCVTQSLARSAEAAEPCTTDDERVDFASVTLCIPKANLQYRYSIDGFVGLQFPPQAFVGDRRVSPATFFDAAGNPPADGTYATIGIKQPSNGGQTDALKQARFEQALNDAFRDRLNDPTFTKKIGNQTYEFRHRDATTIVGTSAPKTPEGLARDIWVQLDTMNQVHHTVTCDYSPSADGFIGCVSRFPVGDSSATIILTGGTPERSFLIAEQIHEDVESFIMSGH